MSNPTTKRCAIYTRKSSEEGLEQEYNSLDAQRDAAEAFIRSQKHEGWKPLPGAYDDGGISGGHLERPALQRLIREIEAGEIDIVVVYKVDRLSRSLADFSQLMQLFDKHGVSFVSVTQQFNTSTSMGRLTLNVLLSFAQFEREVTGERIRDKTALSMKKGMWMGGTPPIGYDVVERKLVINPSESEVVLNCFHIHLESSGLIEAILELNRRGLSTKHFVSRKGRVQGAKPWVAKQLHRVLTNSVYRGLIHHKGNLYPGEHDAIVSEDLWDQVQKKLRDNQPSARKEEGHLNEQVIAGTKLLFPLKGFLQSVEGFALTPSFTNKSSKRNDGTKTRIRYRYYVSQQAIRQGYRGLSIRTLNAELLEEAVRRMLVNALPRLLAFASGLKLTEEQIRHRLHSHAARIGNANSSYELALSVHALQPKIIVAENAIQVHLTPAGLTRLLGLPAEKKPDIFDLPPLSVDVSIRGEEAVIVARLTLKRSRGHTRIFDGDSGEVISVSRTEPRPALIQALAQGEFWRSKLVESPGSTLADVLKPYGIKTDYVRRVLNLAYLAPDIKRSIMQGFQSTMLRVQDLLEVRTMDWAQQRQELGFPMPVSDVA